MEDPSIGENRPAGDRTKGEVVQCPTAKEKGEKCRDTGGADRGWEGEEERTGEQP